MYEFSIEQGSTFDLELSKKQYLAAINLLKAYLKEDETFKEQADTHISICNSHIEDLPKLNKRYNDAILKLEKIEQDEINVNEKLHFRLNSSVRNLCLVF